MLTFLVEEVVNVAVVGRPGRVAVGRGAAGRGSGAAGGSGGVGCAAGGRRAAGADRGGLGGAGALAWAADDLDADLCAVDGRQASDRLGVRDAGARGVGLAASAPPLSDRVGRAGAGGVDGA